MERHDAAEDTWGQITIMHVGRHTHCVSVLDGHICTVGGGDIEGNYLCAVERYNDERDVRSKASRMQDMVAGLHHSAGSFQQA